MEFVTSWWGTLILCIAAWIGTVFYASTLFGEHPNRSGQMFIAASINSIFVLLFIHLVLK